jgi:hypothetical protein
LANHSEGKLVLGSNHRIDPEMRADERARKEYVGTVLEDCRNGTKLCKHAPWKCASVNDSSADLNCAPKEFVEVFQTPLEGRKPIIVVSKCHHNEVVGLCNRYLRETKHDVTYDDAIVEKIIDDLCDKLRPHFDGPMRLEEFMNMKAGRLRARYDAAVAKVMLKGFDPRKHSRIAAFVKDEVYNDPTKDPRMIFGRDPRYNLIYGSYTTPLEKAMKMLPEISKGKNFIERGAQFAALMGGWFVECDFSKYESTQQEKLLRDIELGIWHRLLSEEDYGIMEKLFDLKMIKHGHCTHGVEFELLFNRGSGDMDTGLFNTLINYVATKYFQLKNGFDAGFMVDGDDNVLGLPFGKEQLIDTYAEFGLEAKLVIRKDYHDVEFCSSKFLMINRAGDMLQVQNLNKVLNNIGVMRNIEFRHCMGEYYYSLGYMYSKIYPNMPIISELSSYLMSFTKKRKVVKTDLLKKINPVYLEIFANGCNDTLNIDKEFVLTEYMMSFGFTCVGMEAMLDYLNSTTVNILPEHDKRFRKTGDNPNKTIDMNYQACLDILKGTIISMDDLSPVIEFLKKIGGRRDLLKYQVT